MYCIYEKKEEHIGINKDKMKSFIFFIHNLSNGNILVGDYLIEV
jgi:hypothetical protein